VHDTLYLTELSPDHGSLAQRLIFFPPYKVATLLFQSYEAHIDHICRILHIPTTRALLRACYLRLNQEQSIAPGEAALFFSIFALSTFFFRPFEGSEVAGTDAEAVHLSKTFSKRALDVLDFSRRTTSGSLEDVQASILMSLAISHFDGFSARSRSLSNAAMSIAKDLRLHHVDAGYQSSAETETSMRVLIDREVKRRVFWYITSGDW
jgi:hypothetical protein